MISHIDLRLLFSLILFVKFTAAQNEYVRGCYYCSSAQYRPGRGKYLPEDYVSGLCSHIIFAFVGIDDGYSLKIVEWNDEDLYKRIGALKLKDPGLKTLFSVGGAYANKTKFKSMASIEDNRKKFAENAISFAREWDFDGINIDWEYPDASDKNNFKDLMKELRFAAYNGSSALLISAAVSPGQGDAGYDFVSLGRYLDYVFLMTYDFWGSWSSSIGFNSPLYGRKDMSEDQKVLNTAWSATHWTKAGIPKDKLIIGIATYGRGWKLSEPTTGIPQNKRDAVPFPAKPYSQEDGFAAYYEICDVLSSGGIRYWQEEQKAPYVINNGTEWWGYDDVDSISAKMKWLKFEGYGGAFIWSLDNDDFRGDCSDSTGGKYPLLSAINKELKGEKVSTDDVISCYQSTDP